ncbi:MAG: hypothetical protein ACI8S6_000184 [Myxococcota bacterium]|jgi:hypothetical protein
MTLLTILTSAALAASPKAEISSTLAAFNTAVAAGDADTAAQYLHADGVQVILMPGGPMTVGTEGYLGLIRAGEIGGAPISLNVGAVHVTGPVATASAVRLVGPFQLTDAISLAKLDGGWQIVAMSVAAEER